MKKHLYGFPMDNGEETVELIHNQTLESNHYRLIAALEYMLWGNELNLEGRRIRLAPTLEGGVAPVIISHLHNGATGEEREVIMGFEPSLRYLSEQMQKMPDDEYEAMRVNIAASKAVTHNNRRTP